MRRGRTRGHAEEDQVGARHKLLGEALLALQDDIGAGRVHDVHVRQQRRGQVPHEDAVRVLRVARIAVLAVPRVVSLGFGVCDVWQTLHEDAVRVLHIARRAVLAAAHAVSLGSRVLGNSRCRTKMQCAHPARRASRAALSSLRRTMSFESRV